MHFPKMITVLGGYLVILSSSVAYYLFYGVKYQSMYIVCTPRVGLMKVPISLVFTPARTSYAPRYVPHSVLIFSLAPSIAQWENISLIEQPYKRRVDRICPRWLRLKWARSRLTNLEYKPEDMGYAMLNALTSSSSTNNAFLDVMVLHVYINL